MRLNRWIINFLIIALCVPLPANSRIESFSDNKKSVLLGTLTRNLFHKQTENDNKGSNSSSIFHFRSYDSGYWNDAENWEISADSISWEKASQSPDNSSKSIVISPEHAITINNPLQIDNVKINGKLILGINGKIEFSGNHETGISVNGAGVFEIATSLPYHETIIHPPASAKRTIHVKESGIVSVNRPQSEESGGGYETLAIDPLNIWDHASNFIWNNGLAFKTSGTTYFPRSHSGSIPVFTIGLTEIKEKLTNGPDNPLIINGLLHVQSNLILAGGGKKTFRNGITGTAIIKQDGSIANPGNFHINGENAILGGDRLVLILTSAFNIESDVEIPDDADVTIIRENGESPQGRILKSGNYVFEINGKLDLTDTNMSNTDGSVQINGHLKTAASNGLTGDGSSSVTNGTIKLNPGNTIEYNAQGDQNITSSTVLGSPYYHLVLSGSGVKKPASLININNDGSLKISGSPDLMVDASANNIGPTDNDNNTRFIMENGTLIFGTGGTLPRMKGAYQITGGTIEFTGNSSKTIRQGEYYNIAITGSDVSNSSGIIGIKANGSFVIKNGGVFTSSNGNAAIAGVGGTGQIFRIENGGLFRTAVQAGFYGNKPGNINDGSPSIQNSITEIILDEGSTIEYARKSFSLPGSAVSGDQIITTHEDIYQYQNLILSGDGNKTTSPGTLAIKGNLTRMDRVVFLPDKSSVVFTNNNEIQVLDAPGTTFSSLENQNSKMLRIDSDLSIRESLKLSENSRLHLQSGDITIVSNEIGTARVEKLPNSAEISYSENGGRFRIERFIPEHPKAWQLLSVPASGGTIKESWQNNQEDAEGRGVNITGPAFTENNAKGFDGYSPAPSMKYYNPQSNLYTGISSTDDIISEHSAYFLFVRGDRSVYDPDDSPTQVTIHTRGKLYEGHSNIPGPITIEPGSYGLIGNPYASSVDFKKITISPNLQESYTIWDPNLTSGPHSSYGLGGFREITSDENGGYTVVPSGGNYNETSAPIIQSGQAFFIYNPSETRGIIQFTEDAKERQDINIFRFGSGNENPVPEIRTNLYLRQDDRNILLDGTLQFFGEDFSSEIDQQDSKKMMNSGENIAIVSDHYPLIIERRQLPGEKDTVFYSLTGLRDHKYSLGIFLNKFLKKRIAVLLTDMLTKETIELSEGSNTINFSPQSDREMKNFSRFYLTFEEIGIQPHFTEETILLMQDAAVLKWKLNEQTNVKSQVIEHKTENSFFESAGDIEISDSQSGYYQFVHDSPLPGNNYYRIKAVLVSGETVFSKILETFINEEASTIEIYPNPVKDYLRIKLKNQPKGKYRIDLYNSVGRLVLSRWIKHTEVDASHDLLLPKLSKGIYQIVIADPARKSSRLTVLITE